MKAILYTTALIVLLTLNASFQSLAAPISFEEENYIDDIPFNTECIVMELNSTSISFDFEEESYINDIPFNTEEIAAQHNDDTTCLFEDESYINDIPFETKNIVVSMQFELAMQNQFYFEEEDYIDDIPFETEEIARAKENTRELGFYFAVIHDIQL